MKQGGFFGLAVLIVGGVVVADLVTHAAGTKSLFDGANKFWSTSIHGLLGSTK